MTQNRLKLLVTSNLLQGHTCDTCNFNSGGGSAWIQSYNSCHHPKYCKRYNTCPFWEKVVESVFSGFGPTMVLPIIRKVFPTLIASSLVSVQPMAPPQDSIKYISYKFNNGRKRKKKIEEITMDGPEPARAPEELSTKQKKRKRKPRNEKELEEKWGGF